MFILAFVSLAAYAQSLTVTGKVIDSEGYEVIGSSVTIKGVAGVGTVTDVNGNYTLKVNDASKDVLVFSYVGMTPQEVKVNNRSVINVTLQADAVLLEDVVVIGYAAVPRRDLTGSVTSVSSKELSKVPVSDVTQALTGRMAGVMVQQSEGTPGASISVRVRGGISITQSNEPLYIIDGFPSEDGMSTLDPAEIETIDVLKDASAAAVYGARAANGVVIITTKKGKMGKPVINFSAKVGFVTKANYKEVYDGDGYMKYREDWYKTATYGMNPETGRYEAYQTGTIKPGYYDRPDRLPADVSIEDWRNYSVNAEGQSDLGIYADRVLTQTDQLIRDNFLAARTYDWYNSAYQTGINQDYNASVSGAGEKMNYYMSVGYLRNEGVIRGTEYQAIRANMKLTTNITCLLYTSPSPRDCS